MKFIINTSLEPYFCALLEGEKCTSLRWEEKRESVKLIWAFLDKNKNCWNKIDFIGGITGPGSFSNLRVASCVLSALAFKLNLEIHSISCVEFFDVLSLATQSKPIFLLNAYGDRVFVYRSKKKDLAIQTSADFLNQYSKEFLEINPENYLICLDFLPENKKNIFRENLELLEKKTRILPLYSLENLEIEKNLLLALEKTEPKCFFIPEYGQPAVIP